MSIAALLLSVTVAWAPMQYPVFTTNAVTPEGDHYRSITMYVNISGDPMYCIAMVVNGQEESTWRPLHPDNVFVLRMPAGLGGHTVEYWLADTPKGDTTYYKEHFIVRRGVKRK